MRCLRSWLLPQFLLACLCAAACLPAAGDKVEDVRGALDWPGEWTVFLVERDDPLPPAEALKMVPEALAIGERTVPARRVRPEGGIRLDLAPLFGGVVVNNTAWVFLELPSEEAQTVTLGLGADWWLQAWLNGELFLDTTAEGNVAWPPQIGNFTREVELAAGRNVLAVRFISGSGSSVLTLGGPEQLRAIERATRLAQRVVVETPPVELQVVPNHDFEGGGTGDPFIPEGWLNAEGEAAFRAGEVRLRTTDPLAGEASLEIDTTGAGPVRRRLYAPLAVDIALLHEVSLRGRRLGGDGYVSVSVRSDLSGSETSFIHAVGNVNTTGAISGAAPTVYRRTYYNDVTRPWLVIQAHGEAHVVLDDISIIPLEGHGRQWERFSDQLAPWEGGGFEWNELTEAIETPHTRWARPLAGGPLRVTTLLPRWRHRWTIELAQRMEVSYEPVMFHDPNSLGGDYWVTGPDGEPEVFRVLEDARARVARPADCFVVGYLSPSALPEGLVEMMLAQVEAGAGLVILGYDQPFWPYPDGREPLDKFREGPWARALNEANLLPEGGAPVASGVVAEPTEEFYRYGRGRIAFLKETPVPGAGRFLRGEFEAQVSYIMKAMLWAAGRTAPTGLAGLRTDGAADPSLRAAVDRGALPAEAEVVLSATADGPLTLAWWFDDFSLRRHPGGETTVEAGRSAVPIRLPALPGGEHWLHLQLNTAEGEVVDWNTLGLTVNASPAIRGIKLSRDEPLRSFYRVGERLEGTVAVDGAPGPEHTLVLRVRDADGHLWREQTLADLEGPEIAFSLDIERAVVLMHTLEAELTGPEGVISAADREVAIARESAWYENTFDYQLWQIPWCPCFRFNYLGMLVSEQFRKRHGVTSAYRGDSRINAFNNIPTIQLVGGNPHPGKATAGGESAAPVRRPCLSDPAFRRGLLTGVDNTLGNALPYAPPAYEMAHEANLLGFTSDRRVMERDGLVDLCFSEHCLAGFRRFVEQEHATLEALNASWGTTFDAWEEVRPVTLEEALEAGQVARWVDHRRHMDRVFAEFFRHKIEAVRRHDPGAHAVADNLQQADSYSGVDFWLLLDGVMAGSGLPQAHLRAFTPAERKHLVLARGAYWHPNIISTNHDLFRTRFGQLPWRFLFEDMRGFAYWASIHLGGPASNYRQPLLPDLRTTDSASWGIEPVAQIRTGIDRLIYESRRDDSGIAVLYSRSSEHAATAWQGLHASEAARKLHTSTQLDLFARSLELMNYQYRAVSEQQVAEGILGREGLRLLILPFAQALDVETAAAIRRFVADGGTLLADIRPAMADRHGATGIEGLLDDVFGVRHAPGWAEYAPVEALLPLDGAAHGLEISHRGGPAILGPELEVAGATAIGHEHGRPVLLIHRHGAGRAVLLNFTPLGAGPFMLGTMPTLLRWAGLEPLFSVETLEVQQPERYRPAPEALTAAPAAGALEPADGEGFMFEEVAATVDRPTQAHYVNGRIHAFAFWYSYRDRRRGAGNERVRVTPPAPGHVYDLKTNEYLGRHRGSFETEIPLEGLGAFAVTPYRIGTPAVRGAAGLTRTGNPAIDSEVLLAPRAAASERHVVRRQLFAPDGTEWTDFAENTVVENGRGGHRFILPLNAPRGVWTVRAREAISGLDGSASVLLR